MRKLLILIAIAVVITLLIDGHATRAGQKTASHQNIVNSKKIALKSNGWFEDCYKWKDGDSFKIKLSNSVPLRFSVHNHEKGTNKTFDLMELEVPEQYEGTLIIQSDDIYCLMLYNENPADVIFKYELRINGK